MDRPRILVAIDFSPASTVAARLAAQIAVGRSGSLSLVHVMPLPGAAFLLVEPVVIPPALWDEVAGESRTRVDAKLEELASEIRDAFPGLAVHTDVVYGPTIETLRETAQDFDLLAMGSHGATGGERLFFGSVAESVSREAPCPVLVVPAPRSDAELGLDIDHVVVGVDLGKHSREVASLARDLVRDGGTVELVHVLQPPPIPVLESVIGGSAPKLQEVYERARERAVDQLDRLVDELRDNGVQVAGVVEAGRVEDTLLNRSENANLVVVGTHAREGLREKVLGTTADRVVRHAHGPVLLFPYAS